MSTSNNNEENQMSILDILNELDNTASTNAKVAIIDREKNNALLKKVFAAAYNPLITYYIKQIPEYKQSSTERNDLQFAIDELSQFSSRIVTGNAASNALANLLSTMSNDDAVVIERILQRDLRCGTSDTLASRVWPGIVPTFDVMLSHKDISGIKFPAYAQIKSDGARCHLYFDGVGGSAISRNGKSIELHGMLDNDLALLCVAGDTLDGELVCFKDGKMMDRKTGNGIVNKAVKGTISKDEAAMIHFMCWDKVDFTSTISYDNRIHELGSRHSIESARAEFQNKIRLLPTSTVANAEEAQEFFLECRAAGEEGAMIKNMKAVWEPKRSKNIGKMKAYEEADLKIVGIEEGTGKNTGKLGAYVCETSDGLLRVNVGTGLSDIDRDNALAIGSIITVGYNEIITSKGKDKAALFLPRFICARFDKDVANAFAELK
jgi:ATP-dependent DNA ligase